MSFFYPTKMFERISDIKVETLAEYGISALIIDVDNTLAAHGSHTPDREALIWIEAMKKAGFRLAIASNNYKKRVKPFAEMLKLSYSSYSMKPLTFGFSRISKSFGLPAKSFGIVGDQVFTDILGGNLFGAKTFLVKPLYEKEIISIKLKRSIERLILKNYK